MKKSLTTLSGYQMNEYMLVIQPHEELRNKIVQLKKEFAQNFEAPSAEWGKPHITLVRFSQLQIMEERMFNRLRILTMAMPAFKVDLTNFGSYPSHTIYINVECKVAIKELIKHLKAVQSLFKTIELKPHFMDHFAITIARQLLPWQYDKSWLEYSHKHFTGQFIAKEMLLLRRHEGEKGYQIIQRFEHMNMPVVTTQGVLF